MKLNLHFLLCWLGIHRYRVIDISFGFGPSGSIKTIQCKICGIKKTRKGYILVASLSNSKHNNQILNN